jgi:hypothetical protein
MSHPDEHDEIDRIVRRAQSLGHDPARVARALDRTPSPPVERQAVMEVERRPAFTRFLARAFARRS